MNETKRLDYIDVMRGMAMLLVVFGHIPLYCYGVHGEDFPSFRWFTSMVQLPVFFFVSGYVLGEKMLTGGGKAAIGEIPKICVACPFLRHHICPY